MPPKDLKWSDATLSVRNAQGDWIETGKIVVNPTLEPLESVEVKTYNRQPIEFVAMFSAKFRNKTRLLQVLGVLRSPRLTYRTNMDYINKRRYNGHKRQKKH